jgi:hypothetical protein
LTAETGSQTTASSATDFDCATVVRPALGLFFGRRSQADFALLSETLIRGTFAGWRGADEAAGICELR